MFGIMRRVLFFILSLQLISCKQPVEKVTKKYEDGTPQIIHILEDENDTLNFPPHQSHRPPGL
jgi:hypothetical protein